MQVGDLATWYGNLAIIIREGPASSTGTMWYVFVAGKSEHVFEEDLELINASR